jgi:hypothetical protein
LETGHVAFPWRRSACVVPILGPRLEIAIDEIYRGVSGE